MLLKKDSKSHTFPLEFCGAASPKPNKRWQLAAHDGRLNAHPGLCQPQGPAGRGAACRSRHGWARLAVGPLSEQRWLCPPGRGR